MGGGRKSRRLQGLSSLAAQFSMQHTSDPFPMLVWLGGGVGRDESRGGAGWRLPPACNEETTPL